MTSKPDDPAKPLVVRERQDLAPTASLVKRGLADLEARDMEAADWTNPTIRGWCNRNEVVELFPDGSPGKKRVEFCCDLRNNTDVVWCLQGSYLLFAHSKSTDRLRKLEDAYLSLLEPPIYLQPHQQLWRYDDSPDDWKPFKVFIVSLAFKCLFPEEREPEECLLDVVGDASTIYACNASLETLMVIKLRRRKREFSWKLEENGRWRRAKPSSQ